MKRGEFEHVIRAAGKIVDDELIVIGSQAVLAEFPEAPDSLLRSSEVDLYPRNAPERAIEIDGAIGDGSAFHAMFEYYGHGVGPETFVAPAGWEERLIRLELPAIPNRSHGTVVAWCLAPHDLVLSKLAAGRDHDHEFATTAISAGLVEMEQLRLGAELMPDSHRHRTERSLEHVISALEIQE